jgi:hypothetical protein
MTTTVIIKYITCRPCDECEKPLKGDRLDVRCRTKKRLSFGIGMFCSVKCLMVFAKRKEHTKQATIRGWTFGE